LSDWDTWVASHRFESAAWARVGSEESGRLWDRFDAVFRFRPSVDDFPGIDEPTPSITYDLVYEDGTRVEPVWVERTLLAALRRVTGVDESVVVLNWQHLTYRCRPHRVRDADHPWEPSLCVFGGQLLAAVAEIGDEALGRILRRDGRPAHDAGTGPEAVEI
jgi:hypothetical protein